MFSGHPGLPPIYPFKATNGYLILNALFVQLCLWICVFCKMDEERGRGKRRENGRRNEKEIFSKRFCQMSHRCTVTGERGGLCHFNKRGHYISGGIWREVNITLYWCHVTPSLFSDSLFLLNHSFKGSLLKIVHK